MSRLRRKTLFPLVILSATSWCLLFGLVYWVEPNTVKDLFVPGAYLPFFLVVFLANLFTATLLFGNLRRGLLLGLGITICLGLRLIRLGNVVNIFLLFALIVVVDFYFSSRQT